jgi:hypothetical protein
MASLLLLLDDHVEFPHGFDDVKQTGPTLGQQDGITGGTPSGGTVGIGHEKNTFQYVKELRMGQWGNGK